MSKHFYLDRLPQDKRNLGFTQRTSWHPSSERKQRESNKFSFFKGKGSLPYLLTSFQRATIQKWKKPCRGQSTMVCPSDEQMYWPFSSHSLPGNKAAWLKHLDPWHKCHKEKRRGTSWKWPYNSLRLKFSIIPPIATSNLLTTVLTFLNVRICSSISRYRVSK